MAKFWWLPLWGGRGLQRPGTKPQKRRIGGHSDRPWVDNHEAQKSAVLRVWYLPGMGPQVRWPINRGCSENRIEVFEAAGGGHCNPAHPFLCGQASKAGTFGPWTCRLCGITVQGNFRRFDENGGGPTFWGAARVALE